MLLSLLLQIPGPPDCALMGTCGAVPPAPGPPPGLMYLAIGLVGAGVLGLWRYRRTRAESGPASPEA